VLGAVPVDPTGTGGRACTDSRIAGAIAGGGDAGSGTLEVGTCVDDAATAGVAGLVGTLAEGDAGEEDGEIVGCATGACVGAEVCTGATFRDGTMGGVGVVGALLVSNGALVTEGAVGTEDGATVAAGDPGCCG
jgi:hypothetical protein